MDPLGFAFDNFDAIGRYQETYDGKTKVDARGTLLLGQREVDFEGSRDLIDKVLATPEFARCAAQQLASFALAQNQSAACLGSEETRRQWSDQMSLFELALQVATSKAFTHAKVQP